MMRSYPLSLILVLAMSVAPAYSQAPESTPAQMQALFASLDANHDGVLVVEEVDVESRPVFRSMLPYDKNGDFQLTYEELGLLRSPTVTPAPRGEAFSPQQLSGMRGNENAGVQQSPVPPATANPAEQLFAQLDANKDNLISRREAAGTQLVQILDRLQVNQLDLPTFRSLQGQGAGRGAAGNRAGEARLPLGNNAAPPANNSPSEGIAVVRPQPMVNPNPPQESFTPANPPVTNSKSGHTLLSLLDADHNGRIDIGELRGLANPGVFTKLDTNRDGELDLAEMLGSAPPAAPLQPETPPSPADDPPQPAPVEEPVPVMTPELLNSKGFEKLDVDGDGLISTAERPEWWLESTFQLIDADKDGKVSRDEYLKYMTRSVRRPTTDLNPPATE